VGNLLSLVSKLRALAKILFQISKLAKTRFWASRLGRIETVDVQEFKFVYSKAIEKCPAETLN
jgi:hypothetical protein